MVTDRTVQIPVPSVWLKLERLIADGARHQPLAAERELDDAVFFAINDQISSATGVYEDLEWKRDVVK